MSWFQDAISKSEITVSAETLEVAFTPIFNNYRGSAVRGNKRFELHLVDLKQI